ncbi:MAG TPA: adenylate/guanylate cyclase domain-containing protein [Candidatus Acidoferrum sp.]|nr:adenylate/guanylate cyclase domain-containing protein [Candidatus Acidoferrum sp.]
MAPLDARTRSRLPDSAFAYIDSRGQRRLPINDEAHVRNALARFNQTTFEDEAARDRARTRLLRAAKKYGIVPVGFMTGQLRTQSAHAAAGKAVVELGGLGTPEQLEDRLRMLLGDPTMSVLYWSESVRSYLDAGGHAVELPHDGSNRAATLLDTRGRPMAALLHARTVLTDPELVRNVTAAVKLAIENQWMHAEIRASARDIRTLPTGFVTFLFSDIEDSTGLVRSLAENYEALLDDIRRVLRGAIRSAGGREVETRADEMTAVFERAPAALDAALGMQRGIGARRWPDGVTVRVRIGLHAGQTTLTDTGYIGLAVHTAARICFASHGGQILISEETRDAISAAVPKDIRFRELGRYQLHGLPDPETLFQVEAPDLASAFPPPRTLTAVS